MGIASPRIVIVDDKREHGEAIVRKLWQMGHASLFVEYDQQRLEGGVYGPFRGVRLIFMDLDLAGEGRIGDGSRAYGDVQAVVQAILGEGNGPWALVTWTGHADHADELWSYLQNRLPEPLRPISWWVMDKERLLGESHDAELTSELDHILVHQDAVKCLLYWESGVLDSANEVIAELVKVAATLGGDSTENLGALLYELAKAEAGETLYDDRSQPLYQVLTSLLSDRLGGAKNNSEQGCSKDYVRGRTGVDLADWKRRINVMLNLEKREMDSTCPGAIFEIQEDAVLPHPLEQSKKDIIETEFLYPGGVQNDEQRDNLNRCALCLVDVTPPCDHSQRKVTWRRFVVAAKVPLSVLSNSLRNKLKNKKYINITPEFIEDDGAAFLYIINANLLITLRESDVAQYLGSPTVRLKDQILSDYLGWFGRHITRLGHVWLPTP
jgi:hypothetical protein